MLPPVQEHAVPLHLIGLIQCFSSASVKNQLVSLVNIDTLSPKKPQTWQTSKGQPEMRCHPLHACMEGCGKDLLGSRLFIYKNKLESCFPWLLVKQAFLIYVLASFASEMKTSMAK